MGSQINEAPFFITYAPSALEFIVLLKIAKKKNLPLLMTTEALPKTPVPKNKM